MSSVTQRASVEHQLQSVLSTLEHRFADLEHQISSLQRLAAMGTASATLAHEFNNMLTPVLSYCQFALDSDDPDLLRSAAEKTISSIKRLTGISNRIMNLAANPAGETKTIAIRDVVLDAVECLGRDLQKDDIQLKLEIPADLKIRVDASALHQVLFNLFLNARQAMLNRGGELHVRADRTGDSNLTIEVADTGPGIPPEHMGLIFEPFFSTRRNEQGAGLGLHVCRQLMHEMRGEISVESTPGKGTRFKLLVPPVAS